MSDWTERAACRPGDPNDWIPGPRQTRGWNARQRATIARCKAICATCPVTAECLAEAMRTEAEVSIRAGLTVEERYALHSGPRPRVPKPIKHGSLGGYSQHRRRGEQACDECKAAAAHYATTYRRANG